MDFAAAEPADVPAGAEGAAPVDVGAAAVDGEGADGNDEPAAAVTLVACLEPKMADTILPKTLIFSSLHLRRLKASIPKGFNREGPCSDWQREPRTTHGADGVRCYDLRC